MVGETTTTSQFALLRWGTSHSVATQSRKEFDNILLLALWEVWKHRNAIVFDRASPSVSAIIAQILEEV